MKTPSQTKEIYDLFISCTEEKGFDARETLAVAGGILIGVMTSCEFSEEDVDKFLVILKKSFMVRPKE